ncbi:MAG: DUF2189 domain-containing protein [Gammaproteobacteria bacterium]|nr:DUF2189 domain-containing protein [Gammaproteobacteria bacterium]
MNDKTTDTAKTEEKLLPFCAKVNIVPINAPIKWIHQGAEDMRKAPAVSLTYGFALTLLSIAITYLSWSFGTLGLYLGMATGFLLIGPVLAIGLYSFSCQLEQGRKPILGYCIRESRVRIKDIVIFSLILLIVFLLWARAATAVHIFFPENSNYSIADLAMFLGIGTAIGAFFSTIVFTTSAFSLPMLMDRETDAITAVVTSVNAVLRNKKTMLIWAIIIVSFVIIGFITFFIGFIVFLPLIGHATWHAYRDTIDASEWPEHDKY